MKLDVLTGRQIGVTVAEDRTVVWTLGEGIRRHPDLTDLGRRHHAPGHLDAQHEGVTALALRVHAHPLQPFHLAGHGGDGTRPLFRVGVDHRLGDLERMARQLELLHRVELTDVAVGTDELQPAVTPAAEFHPVGVVEVAWH